MSTLKRLSLAMATALGVGAAAMYLWWSFRTAYCLITEGSETIASRTLCEFISYDFRPDLFVAFVVGVVGYLIVIFVYGLRGTHKTQISSLLFIYSVLISFFIIFRRLAEIFHERPWW